MIPNRFLLALIAGLCTVPAKADPVLMADRAPPQIIERLREIEATGNR